MNKSGLYLGLTFTALLSFLAGCGADRASATFGRTTIRGPVAGTFLHFSYPGDEGNAGSFNYRGFDDSALSIVGAGADSVHRSVRIYDDLTVTGELHPSGSQATITAGVGAPKMPAQQGSIYLRTDGSIGSHLYVSAGKKVWRPILGV